MFVFWGFFSLVSSIRSSAVNSDIISQWINQSNAICLYFLFPEKFQKQFFMLSVGNQVHSSLKMCTTELLSYWKIKQCFWTLLLSLWSQQEVYLSLKSMFCFCAHFLSAYKVWFVLFYIIIVSTNNCII